MAETSEEVQRQRNGPTNRFAGKERLRNLDSLTRTILKDNPDEVHLDQGHRQYTLVQQDGLTVALFHFEEGGELAEHRVDGVTCLQVLDGELGVETERSQRVMSSNDFFVIDRNFEHSVSAYRESRAIMTMSDRV